MPEEKLYLCEESGDGGVKPETCKLLWSIAEEEFESIAEAQDQIERRVQDITTVR